MVAQKYLDELQFSLAGALSNLIIFALMLTACSFTMQNKIRAQLHIYMSCFCGALGFCAQQLHQTPAIQRELWSNFSSKRVNCSDTPPLP